MIMTTNEPGIVKSELPSGHPPIVSPEAWTAARQQMLVKEKAFTRSRDALI
jgi:predicted dithiol-disulfide oxidoreductase (DUF899 family)